MGNEAPTTEEHGDAATAARTGRIGGVSAPSLGLNALVLGIIGLFFFNVPFGVIAMIVGYRGRTARDWERYAPGKALAGMILGAIDITIGIVWASID